MRGGGLARKPGIIEISGAVWADPDCQPPLIGLEACRLGVQKRDVVHEKEARCLSQTRRLTCLSVNVTKKLHVNPQVVKRHLENLNRKIGQKN